MAPLIIKPVLVVGLVAVLSAPAAAPAQPIHDVYTPATAAHWRDGPSASQPSLTFTNPLGRSRGPGAGAGLL
jgi:hypothetical protein